MKMGVLRSLNLIIIVGVGNAKIGHVPVFRPFMFSPQADSDFEQVVGTSRPFEVRWMLMGTWYTVDGIGGCGGEGGEAVTHPRNGTS